MVSAVTQTFSASKKGNASAKTDLPRAIRMGLKILQRWRAMSGPTFYASKEETARCPQ
jgi:hypothetical protein